MGCVFCDIESKRIVNMDMFVLRDIYPVSPGHTLIIPERHVETYFDMTWEEKIRLWETVEIVKRELEDEFGTRAFNIGFNVGETAGQTVMHCHVHVIPRFEGDMEDPRGGVRGVIPSKQKYEKNEG